MTAKKDVYLRAHYGVLEEVPPGLESRADWLRRSAMPAQSPLHSPKPRAPWAFGTFLSACAICSVAVVSGGHATADHGGARAEIERLRSEVYALHQAQAREHRARAALELGLEEVVRLSRHEAPPQLFERIREIAWRAGVRIDDTDDPRQREHAYDASKPALTTPELQALIAGLHNAFASESLSIVDLATRQRRLQAEQAIAIMRACSFESTRLEVATLLASRLIDTELAGRLSEGFDFASSASTYRKGLLLAADLREERPVPPKHGCAIQNAGD